MGKCAIARADELKEFSEHGVYLKVPIEECWKAAGKDPIGARWVDINKEDEAHPEYRSRFVAKDSKTDKREDLFASTPPLEAPKLLLSLVMTEGVGYMRERGGRHASGVH